MKTRENKHSIYSSIIDDEKLDYTRECILDSHYKEYYLPTDEEVYETAVMHTRFDWDDVSELLADRFATGKFLLIGEAGRWNGTFDCGKVLDGYKEVSKAWSCSDYMDIELYDLCKGGHYEFHVLGHHHDGTDHFILKELTDRGVEYFEKWENNWNDKRTEQEVHQILWNNSHYTKNIEFTKRYYR